MIAVVLAGLILLSLVLWARDVITIAILGSILVVFVAVIRMRRVYGIQLALRFIAIYVLLRAIRAPLALLDGTDFGDGAALSNLTGVPEFLWVFIWFSVGIGGLAHLWKQHAAPESGN